MVIECGETKTYHKEKRKMPLSKALSFGISYLPHHSKGKPIIEKTRNEE